MVNDDGLDSVFGALSDSTRRAILLEIAKGSPTVGELGQPFDMSGPAISKHLKVLERAGLVTRIREGKVNRFSLNPERFEEAEEVLNQIKALWLDRAERFDAEPAASVVADQDEEMWKY